MRTTLFYALALFVSAGCSSSKYQIVEPTPQLSLSTVTAVCELGETVNITLTVAQEGVDGNFSLSAFIREGKATLTLDGSDMDTSGQWVQLAAKHARLVITPAQAGDLLVSFQAKSPDGEVSEQQDLKVTVTAPSEITAEAVCEAKIVNPAADARIPVQLHIQGVPGADGKFIVTPTVSLGKGKIFLNGNAVNGQACPVDADVTFEYAPEEIGEQILEFEIAAGKASAKARAYMDVVKNIVVTSVVEGCFTIDGAGEHNVEGETVTLALVNEDLFNFEVEGWYDPSGQLLSGEATYALTLARDCITDIQLRLKPRTVTITRQGIARIEFQYLVMEGGRPVPKVAYDYRTQYSADYKASEPIKFYYEEYRLDRSKIPPVGQRSTAMPTITKGARNSTYLWRCDEKFSVSIHPGDNPGFKFHYNDRYIESANTKYYLPPDITMMK